MAMQTVILHNVKLSFFCVASLLKMGSHKKKKKKDISFVCKSFRSRPIIIPTGKERAETSCRHPEERTNSFVWCLQEASPSVGDGGVVGETEAGFRVILSSSA